MNPDLNKQFILKNKKIFNAWLNGKQIQFYDKVDDRWYDLDFPAWDGRDPYRIKPNDSNKSK